jgi:hypothetical protein
MYFILKKEYEYSLAPSRDILLDIDIIRLFTAKFGLWHLLFADGTLFFIIPGKCQNIHIK